MKGYFVCRTNVRQGIPEMGWRSVRGTLTASLGLVRRPLVDGELGVAGFAAADQGVRETDHAFDAWRPAGWTEQQLA